MLAVLAAAVFALPQELPAEQLLWTLPGDYPELGFRGWVAPATLRFVAHAAAEGGTLVFVDGEPDERAHAYVNPPAFSPDGEHVAWSYGDPSGRRQETWRIVADGKESKKLDWAGPVVVDADGKAYAWVGDGVELSSEGFYEGGDYQLMAGRRTIGEEFEEAPPRPPQLLPGGRVAFVARDAKGYRVVCGKQEFGPFWWVTGFAVSRDGKRVVWVGAGGEARRDPLAGLGSGRGFGGRMRVRDGEREWGEGYTTVGAPALGGPDGAHLAYLARNDEGVLVVVDERELPGVWDDIGTPVFSPDGSRVAYAVNKGTQTASAGIPILDPTWMDGGTVLPRGARLRPPGADGPEQEMAGQRVSPCSLVIDGVRQEGEFRRVVRPVWSADGSTVAVRVQGDEGWHVLAGGTLSEAYDEVGPPVLARDGSQVGFAARKGRELWWKVLAVEAAREPDGEGDAADAGDDAGDPVTLRDPAPRVEALAAPEPDAGRYPALAAAPDGSVHAVWTARDGGASALRHARFDGVAWSNPSEVARGERWFVNWADFPQVCVAADGTVMATWLARTGEGSYDYAVQYALRGPKDAAWSGPRRLHSHDGGGEHGFVSLLPEGEGFRAVWLDGRNTAAAQAGGDGAPAADGHGHGGGHGGGAMALYTAHVTASGEVRDERMLDERVCDCCATTVAELPGGGWGVAYRDRSEDEVRDIGWVTGGGAESAQAAADGRGMSDGISADLWRIAACPVNGPDSARNGDRVAVAWFTMGMQQRPDCRFAVRGAERSFGFPLDFDLGSPVGRAAVCAWPGGGFLLAWMEESEGEASWMARTWSPEGGLSEAVRIAAAPGGRASGFLRLAPLADGALAAWTDPQGGVLRFARVAPSSDG